MTTDESGHGGVDRRSLLAAGTTLGAVALAGCAGESPADAANETRTPPQRPSGTVDDEYWRYILDSIEYQNAMLQQLTDGDG